MEWQDDFPQDHAFVEMMGGLGEADIQLLIRETEEKLRLNSCSIEQNLLELQDQIGESWAGDKVPSHTECLQQFSQCNLGLLKPVTTDHQELLDFLKALQHLLKTEEAREEAVLHLLLNISSKFGIAFPFSSSLSDRSRASFAPFCSITDDLALGVQETWDDICHLLCRYLLDKLSMVGTGVPQRIFFLQQLCFLYPKTEVLEKYKALQSKAVLEMLRKTQSSCLGGEKGFERLSQVFHVVSPGFCAMLSEDIHVLNGVYEPYCILDFLNQTYLSMLVKELEFLLEREVEVALKDNAMSGGKSRRSSGKKAAVAPQEGPKRGIDIYLTSQQLNGLVKLATTLLELERRVEDLAVELGFLNCAGESTSMLRGGIKTGRDEAEVHSTANPEMLLQTTEVVCLEFGWRTAFQALVPQMAHCVKVVLEDVCCKSLQQEESTHGSSTTLIPLVHVSPKHGTKLTCSVGETPKMVAKFCGDVMEKLNDLLPLAVACKDDALLPVRSCFVEVCGQVSSALLTEVEERAREVPHSSPHKNLTTLLASSSYIHQRLIYYESQLGDASHRPLTLLPIQRSQEVMEAVHKHLTGYCIHVCASSLLQDAESHHWADDKPFYEGERCSFSIQMWHYFLSALRTDLWYTVSPVTAQQTLTQVLAQTLELLLQRYSRAQPSYKRLAQIRIDITAILLCVEQLMWSVCGSVEELVGTELVSAHEVSIIHSLCNQLMIVLIILTAPLPDIYRTFHRDTSSSILAESSSSIAPFWLNIINPTVFPEDLLREGAESEGSALWHLNLVSSAPGFSPALVLQAILHSDCLMLRLLLSNSYLCLDSDVKVSPEVETSGAELVEAIFAVLSPLNIFPRALAQVLEEYLDERHLWNCFYSLADSVEEKPLLFKCVRADLFKPINILMGHLVRMMQACEDLPGPLFRQEIPKSVQAKIPKEWNYISQEAKSKDTNKNIISLTIQALSFIFTHLSSSVASIPLPVRFLFHKAEKQLCQRDKQLRPTGLLIYALLCCLCQSLEDCETLELVSAELLERGVKERLALLSECIKVSLGQEKGVLKPIVHKILQGLEEKRPKWSAMQLQKACKLCNESIFERAESNLVQERGVPSKPAKQKMGPALLALCQLAGGIQNLQQIHHTIQLNEGLLRSRLTSGVDGPHSAEGQPSVLSLSTENKMSSPTPFDPLFHFDRIGHVKFDQSAMSEREWDWARLLSSYQRLSQVTFRHLLANRWEMQDGAELEDEEMILVESLKRTYLNPAPESSLK